MRIQNLMSNRDPEATYHGPTQAIAFYVEEWARQNIRTAVPGIVRAYDATTMRARVQPALRAIVSQPDGTDEAMDRASIMDVPVTWIGAGGFVSHMPLTAGDTVWLMFSERGIAEFKRTLGMADPPPMVMFQARDAVALPWRTAAITPVDGATIQTADGSVYVAVEAARVTAKAPNVVLDGDVQITGSLAVDGSGLTHDGVDVGKTHVHTAVATGPPTSVSGPPRP